MKKRLLKKIREQVKPKQPKFNYLKYMRTCRRFIQKKHDISLADLEVLLFFYDEDQFTKADALKYIKGLQGVSTIAFNRLISMDLIVFYRNYGFHKGHAYTLTPMAKNIIREFYSKLHGEEVFSQNDLENPKFKDSPIYSPAYLKMIEKLKEETRESGIRRR